MPSTPTMSELETASANAIEDMENLASGIQDPPGSVTFRNGQTTPNFRKRLQDVAFKVPVSFTSGLTAEDGSFTVTHEGVIYSANPSETPFTTTGTFVSGQWLVLRGLSADGVYSAELLGLTDGEDAASRLSSFLASGVNKIVVPEGKSVRIDTLCEAECRDSDVYLNGHFDCSGGGRIVIQGTHEALPNLASTVSPGIGKSVQFAAPHGLEVGDHVCFWDETDFSAGLARYYYRQGWRGLVAEIVSPTIVKFFGSLPVELDHAVMSVAKVTGGNVALPETCKFTPAPGETNPVILLARLKHVNVRAQVENGAAYQAIGVTQCYNVVSRDSKATALDGDAYPINVSCCGGGLLESVALFSSRHVQAIGGGGGFDGFSGNTPMRDFTVKDSIMRSSGNAGAADAHGASFGCRFVNCIMDAGWALGGGDHVGVDCTIICNGGFGVRMTEVDGGVIRLENPHFITYGAQSEGAVYLFPGFLSRDLTLIINNPTYEHRGGATDQIRPLAIHALSSYDWDVSAGAPSPLSHVNVFKVTVAGTYDGHAYDVDDLAIYTSHGPSGGKVIPIEPHRVDVKVTGARVVGSLTSVIFTFILGNRDVSSFYSLSIDELDGPGGVYISASQPANYNMPLRLPEQSVRTVTAVTSAATSVITSLLNFSWQYPRPPDCEPFWHIEGAGGATSSQLDITSNIYQRTRNYARCAIRRDWGAAFGSNYDAVLGARAWINDLA